MDEDGGGADEEGSAQRRKRPRAGGGGAAARGGRRARRAQPLRAMDSAERALLARFWRATHTLQTHGVVRPYKGSLAANYVEKGLFRLVEYADPLQR